MAIIGDSSLKLNYYGAPIIIEDKAQLLTIIKDIQNKSIGFESMIYYYLGETIAKINGSWSNDITAIVTPNADEFLSNSLIYFDGYQWQSINNIKLTDNLNKGISGVPADSAVVNNFMCNIVNCERKSSSNDNFTFVYGGILSNGNLFEAQNRIRTAPLLISPLNRIYVENSNYRIKQLYTYEKTDNIYAITETALKRQIIGSSNEMYSNIVFSAEKDEDFFVVVLARTDNANIEENEIPQIQSQFHIYIATDSTLQIPNVPPDSQQVGNALQTLQNNYEQLVNDTYEFLDKDSITYSFGGINIYGNSGGDNDEVKHRIRTKTTTTKGAFQAKPGTKFEIADNFKFSVYIYDEYNSGIAGQNHMIYHRPMSSDSFTIPSILYNEEKGVYENIESCYVRISIGAIGNDALWAIDENDGTKKLTDKGEEAWAALKLKIVNRSAIDIALTAQQTTVLPEKLIIPPNAIQYYQLWDDLKQKGQILLSAEDQKRHDDIEISEAAEIEQDDYQLRCYRILYGNGYMESNYKIKTMDSNNFIQPTNRPKIFITSGMHGMERATPIFLYEFIKRLFDNPTYSKLLYEYDWTIIPLVNPWGFSNSWADNQVHTDIRTSPNNSIVPNDDTHYCGIRHNENMYDINRDFYDSTVAPANADSEIEYLYEPESKQYGFKTQEAQFVRTMFDKYGPFDIVIDLHQAPFVNSSEYSQACGFIAGNTNINKTNDQLYTLIRRVCGETDSTMRNYIGLQNYLQTSFPWKPSNLYTFRNYGAKHLKDTTWHVPAMSICLETNIYCAPYSKSVIPYNSIAMTYGNTFTDNFLYTLLSNYELISSKLE